MPCSVARDVRKLDCIEHRNPVIRTDDRADDRRHFSTASGRIDK